jgi:wyosine [tRNA(Phe)-imidazoG37] synthetase (radical SAM superfamily)
VYWLPWQLSSQKDESHVEEALRECDESSGDAEMMTFGPIPSRRLGRSLGINNIPPKSCSYSCVYCQVGPTGHREIEPRSFYKPGELVAAVETRLEAAEHAGETVDYLTFVPDGEPTLDINLGKTIKLLRPLGVKIAVITNASLLWREEVRERLLEVDWLSVKIDAVDEQTWRQINRPHPGLQLQQYLEGVREMGRCFRGDLNTETMLVEGINDGESSIGSVAEYLGKLDPDRSCIAIPIRPVAEPGNRPASEATVNLAYQLFSRHVRHVETLIGYEGDAFATTGDVVEDLLSITAVHPMREEAVLSLLAKQKQGREVLDRLVKDGQLRVTVYEGRRFYLRAIR